MVSRNYLHWAYNQKGEYEAALEEMAKCDATVGSSAKHRNMMISYYQLGRWTKHALQRTACRVSITAIRYDWANTDKSPTDTATELEELRKMDFPENYK